MACIRSVAAAFKKNFQNLLGYEQKRQEAANEEKHATGLKPYTTPYKDCPSADEISKYAGKTISIVVPEETKCEEARKLLFHR